MLAAAIKQDAALKEIANDDTEGDDELIVADLDYTQATVDFVKCAGGPR